MYQKIEFIRKHTSVSDVLCQLAEESAELAKAALKLRRAITKGSPTPLDECTAMDNLIEEIADVSLCLKVLGIDCDNGAVCLTMVKTTNEKMARWSERIEEARGRGEWPTGENSLI